MRKKRLKIMVSIINNIKYFLEKEKHDLRRIEVNK